MLKSKRDESIKRYLSKVGRLKHNSKNFPSRYYIITYNEKFEITVRFSDHFNDTVLARGISIDIVKTSLGFYTIRLVQIGITYTTTEDLVLSYLKSILLIYPEMSETVTAFRNAADTAVKTSTKALAEAAASRDKLNKKDEYINMVDAIYEENKALIKNITELRTKYAASENTINQISITNSALKKKVSEKAIECENLKGKLKKLANLLNSI